MRWIGEPPIWDDETSIVRLREPGLSLARQLVQDCLLNPAGDAAGFRDRSSEAAVTLRQAADVMHRIGWPGDLRTEVALTNEDAHMIRWAAMAGLGAAAEELEDATRAVAQQRADWDGDEAVAELERIINLLDQVGWPPGSERRRTGER